MRLTPTSKRTLCICALLAALTLGTFWPVVHHEFLGYDDQDYVTANDHVQRGLTWDNVAWAFRTTEAANWHPLTWLSHMLDAQLFDLKPGLHHLTNVLLHVANTLLLFLLLQRMTGAALRSALVAALFALHPLHVESVAWVAERKDVLSTCFFMLTLLAYTRYVESKAVKTEGLGVRGQAATVRGSRFGTPLFYALSLLVFALGLMSKPMLVTLPFVLLLLDYWPLRRFQADHLKPEARTLNSGTRVQNSGIGRLLLEKIPFLALAIASCIITLIAQRGAVAHLGEFPMSGRVINALASYLKYLGKTAWPTDLAVFYPHPANPRSGLTPWPIWQAVAAALILIGMTALAILRRKQQPWLTIGWFWYLGTLLPVIGLIQAGSQAMADRYTYIPLIGIFICVAWGLPELLMVCRRRSKEFRVSGFEFRVSGVLGVLAVAACVIFTHEQLTYWQNDFTLFSRALAVHERNAPAHAILGTYFGRQGKFGIALVHGLAATQADPAFAGGWHTLGDIYDSLGRQQDAVSSYQQALHWNPLLLQTWFRLGCVYGALNKSEDAERCYREALRLGPGFVPAHNNLAILLVTRGRKEEGLKEFAQVIALRPSAPDKHYNLGIALEQAGKLLDAATEYGEAVRLKPDYIEALASLGNVLTRQGKASEALLPFAQIVRLRPSDTQAHLRLGAALLMAGQTNEATATFALAARLDPVLARKTFEAGDQCLAKGQLDEALRNFTSVTWLQPENIEAHKRLGLILSTRSEHKAAQSHFEEIVRRAPGVEALYNLGRCLAMQGNLSEALTNYQQALKLAPDTPAALNDMAWIRATAPQAGLRDGAEAVRLVQRALEVTGGSQPSLLATLAAAYAEAGQFSEAVSTAEKVRDLALANGDKAGARAAEERLAIYKAGKPFRQ